MKLLFFVEHFSMAGSGAENDAVNLCRALEVRGHEIHVVCKTGEQYGNITLHNQFQEIAAVIENVNPERTVDWGLFHRADIHRLGGGAHMDFLKYKANAYSGLAKTFKLIENRRKKHRRIIKHEKSILSNPKALFLANSQFCARQLINSGAAEEKTKVLYNGYDFSRFKPVTPVEKSRLRSKYNLKEDDVVFTFIAHNLRLKNYKLLKTVFAELAKTLPQVKLVVVGKRKPSGSSKWLNYIGTTSDINEIYQLSDALLHPTFYDSCANVVFEALSCGIPVISSNVNGSSELIDKNCGAVLSVHGKNSERLWLEAIKNLVDGRKKFAVDACLKAVNNLDYDRFVDQFEDFMNKS